MAGIDIQSVIQWLVSGAISAGVMLLTLRFSVKALDCKLTDALAQVKEIRADMHAFRAESTGIQKELALVTYRVEQLEKSQGLLEDKHEKLEESQKDLERSLVKR